VAIAGNNLNPVSIWIENKGNMLHSAVTKFLLELVARILDSLAGSLDVVDGNAQMAETTMGLSIAIVHLVFSVVLCSIVVG
jgi:hypothetical protein